MRTNRTWIREAGSLVAAVCTFKPNAREMGAPCADDGGTPKFFWHDVSRDTTRMGAAYSERWQTIRERIEAACADEGRTQDCRTPPCKGARHESRDGGHGGGAARGALPA